MISSGNSTGSAGSGKLRSITSSVELRQRRSTLAFGGPTTLKGNFFRRRTEREHRHHGLDTRLETISTQCSEVHGRESVGRGLVAGTRGARGLSRAGENLETVDRLPSQIGGEGASRIRVGEGGARTDDLQLLQRQSEAVPKATDQHRHLRSLRPSVEMGLVQNKEEALVRVGCVVLRCTAKDIALNGAQQHVFEHRVVRHQEIGHSVLHLVAKEQFGILRALDGAYPPVSVLPLARAVPVGQAVLPLGRTGGLCGPFAQLLQFGN